MWEETNKHIQKTTSTSTRAINSFYGASSIKIVEQRVVLI